MLTGKKKKKRDEDPRGQISCSGPTTPCRSWSSGTPTPSLRFKRNPPWPIGCPLARLYADSLRHVPKGAQRRCGTLWIMSAGHLFLTPMQPSPPTIWYPMRGQKTTAFFIKARRQTVPGSSHGRLLLSPQQWRSGALAGSRGAPPPRYLCTWKCLWIQVRDRIRSATRAAVYYTTSEGAPTLKCESACYRPFFQKPWNNNGLWLERYPWVTLAAFHKVELFTVRWIKERVAAGAGLFHMNGVGGEKFL